MIIFDLHHGRYSILALKEPDMRLGVLREGAWKVEVNLRYIRLILSDCRRASVQ
jgi:hypothetical protein